MKKITAILTAAILLAAMLAACADPSKAGAKSAGAVTDTQTETAAETGLGSDTEPLEIPMQTEAAPDSTTAEQPETPPEEPEDTTPVPERGVTLNTDLLGEYKMTYAELTAKHGKLVDFTIPDGIWAKAGSILREDSSTLLWMMKQKDCAGVLCAAIPAICLSETMRRWV